MRKLTIAAVILLILAAGVALALLNLDKLVKRNKDYILAQTEQALGRKVGVDDIGVTLWGGIGVRLENLTLADDPAFSTQDFLRAANLQVNVALLPLLRKEVRVKRLILRRPVISIIRDKAGTFNFASLGGPRKVDREAKREGPAPPPGSEALPFLISLVDMSSGEVHYVDKKEGVDLRVSRIDLEVEDLGLDRPVSIDLAASVLAEGQNVKVKGRVGPVGSTLDPATVPIDAQFEIDGLNIGEIERRLPQMRQWLPQGLDLSGPLRAKAKVSGKRDDLTLTDVRLSAAVFGADKPNFELTGRVSHVTPSLKGLSLNGDVALGPVTLAKLKRFAPVASMLPKDLSADGPVSLKAHAEGTLDKLAFTGAAEASESGVQFGELFRKPPGTPLRLSADATLSGARIDIKKAHLKLHTLDLTTSGAIVRDTTPTLRLDVSAGRTDLAGWEKMIPMLQAYNVGGTLEVQARIEGPMAAGRVPNINGSLTLADLKATVPQVPQPVTAKRATLTFTGQRADLPETPFTVGKSQMRLAAQIERFAPVSLTYRMAATELHGADFRAGGGTGKKPEVLREVTSDGRATLDQGTLSYQGRVASARGTIADLDYTNLRATISMANQVAIIESFELRTLNGSLQGRGQYDMRASTPRFTVTTQVRGFDLAELLGWAAPAAPRHLRGGINLDLNLAGSGNRWEETQRSLSGQGQAEIMRGAVLDVNIAESTLAGLTSVPGLSMLISPRVRSKYPVLFATRNTEFGQLKGSLALKDGRLHLDNLLVAATDWVARGQGSMGLDQSLDMRTVVLLSRELSTDLIADVKGLKYLTNKEGRLEIPVALTGTLPQVTPQPDLAYVTRLLQRRLVEEGIEGATKGLLKPKSPPAEQSPSGPGSTPPAAPAKPPEKKPEEELLKGLKDLLRR